MYKIKFGTDGWRAIIAKDYTIDNLKRISYATARWMVAKKMSKVVIGYDCRFGGKMFAECAASVFAHSNIDVILSDGFVSTPMVSLGVVKYSADMGIVITASHNPPSYNGFKLKSSFGGPTIPTHLNEIESIIQDDPLGSLPTIETLVEQDKVVYEDLEQMYVDHIEDNFDLDLIRSKVTLAYDAMYGAGQNVIRRLFPSAKLIHCDFNPGFHGRSPEPILRNLPEIATFLKRSTKYALGLANDGDADRIGLFDEDGAFVDSHHILLLLLKYLYEHKGMAGKVVTAFSVTNKMDTLAKHYGLEMKRTKIGFKYIAEIMINEDVLVGGEESGGLAVKGHIPERDGIWTGLIIMEFIAKTGKSLKELVKEIHELVGPFYYSRDDLHLTESKKQAIISYCKNGNLTSIGPYEIIGSDDLDGFKYYIPDDGWLMIRPSGTEPVLRVYAQASSEAGVKDLLKNAHEVLSQIES